MFEVRDRWPKLPREMGLITNPVVLGALSALEWMSYRSAHCCIARRGVAEDRTKMVPNGCNLELFEAGKAKAWRLEGVIESDLLAVFTETHGQANGLDAVLDAAVALKARKRRGIKLVFLSDGKLNPELLERTKAEGLDNVIFHNQISKHKVTGLLAGADIGMQCLTNLPAFYNGTSPNKFFDYITASLPVLNNYPGWLAQIITYNDCVYAVRPDDAEAFADALEAAANHKALVRKGQAALALARDDFDRNKLGARWFDWVAGASGERT